MAETPSPAVSVSTEAGREASGGDERPSPLALLFQPDRAMERHAKVGRVRWIFLFAWLCSILLGATLAYRVDARGSTLQKLDKGGQLQTMSDRQLADETRNAERISQVSNIAKGVVGTPLQLGGASLAVLGLAWFLRGRIKGAAVVPVAAATLLPGAIAKLLDAVSAFRHASIPDEGVALVPRSLSAILTIFGRPPPDPWVKFGSALDFFSLWAAVMLGFGVAAVGQLPKKSALTGTLIAWVCYQLLTHVAT